MKPSKRVALRAMANPFPEFAAEQYLSRVPDLEEAAKKVKLTVGAKRALRSLIQSTARSGLHATTKSHADVVGHAARFENAVLDAVSPLTLSPSKQRALEQVGEAVASVKRIAAVSAYFAENGAHAPNGSDSTLRRAFESPQRRAALAEEAIRSQLEFGGLDFRKMGLGYSWQLERRWDHLESALLAYQHAGPSELPKAAHHVRRSMSACERAMKALFLELDPSRRHIAFTTLAYHSDKFVKIDQRIVGEPMGVGLELIRLAQQAARPRV